MGSIPKIVLTPLKWASKQVVHRTLLRFPGGDPHDPIACAYCPEMCRFSCPTAVASGNDAVTPCNKMSLLHKEDRWPGRAAQGGQLWPIYDCTGCGRCTNYCVYGMPVGETLFEARKHFAWDRARQVAVALSDAEDPAGDLADELGDEEGAARRLERVDEANRQRRDGARGVIRVDEARSMHFLLASGREARLSWQAALGSDPRWEALRRELGERAWLLHESVWLSRKLEAYEHVEDWRLRAEAEGIRLARPFHHGKDCIDCGGEGAYARLFPMEARVMARELWERDRHRAEGVFCLSERCARHLRDALGASVPVRSLQEIWEGGA